MGCAGSRFDMMPVTGHPSGIAVISQNFVRPVPTILKLPEKILSWTGDDFSVKVCPYIFFLLIVVRESNKGVMNFRKYSFVLANSPHKSIWELYVLA